MSRTILLYFVLLLVARNDAFSQSGWIYQNSGTTSALRSVHFVDSNTGWTCGTNGTILRTTNGGLNWVNQNSGTTLQLRAIMFADHNTGWAVGGSDLSDPLCQYSNVIDRTTNGGVNWISSIGNGNTFNNLFVTSNQNLYYSTSGICCPTFCIVSTGSVIASTNSGQNWFGRIGNACYSIFFLNQSTGWVTATYTSDVPPSISYIYKTGDNGNNWSIVRSDTSKYFSAEAGIIMFANASTGYLLGNYLLKSTDGGTNWFKADSTSTLNSRDLHFVNPDTGWIVGPTGKIIRTNNGGINWTNQLSNTSNWLTSVYFSDSYTGWIVGSGGTILKTITGGLTSVTNSASYINNFQLLQNYPNPFNPNTIINYELRITGYVKLTVYDINGKEVSSLVNQKQNAGSHKVEFNGSNFASGIYLYKLETGEFSETKSMILLK